jgi:hypothetical protein
MTAPMIPANRMLIASGRLNLAAAPFNLYRFAITAIGHWLDRPGG